MNAVASIRHMAYAGDCLKKLQREDSAAYVPPGGAIALMQEGEHLERVSGAVFVRRHEQAHFADAKATKGTKS